MAMGAPQLDGVGAKRLDRARDESRAASEEDPLLRFVRSAPYAQKPMTEFEEQLFEKVLQKIRARDA